MPSRNAMLRPPATRQMTVLLRLLCDTKPDAIPTERCSSRLAHGIPSGRSDRVLNGPHVSRDHLDHRAVRSSTNSYNSDLCEIFIQLGSNHFLPRIARLYTMAVETETPVLLRIIISSILCTPALAGVGSVIRQEAPFGYSFVANTPGRAPGTVGQFFTLQAATGSNNREVFQLSSSGWLRVSPASSVQRRYAIAETSPDGSRALIAIADPALPIGGLIWDAASGLSQIQTPSNITGYSPTGWSDDGRIITGRGVSTSGGLGGTVRDASNQWRVNSATFAYGSPSPDGTLAFGSYTASDGRIWPASWNLSTDTLATTAPARGGETADAFSSLNRMQTAFSVSTRNLSTGATQDLVFLAASNQYVALSAPLGFVGARAESSNADASLIVGITVAPNDRFTPLVFAWTPTTGSLLLQDYLARFGADFTGWASLETARVSLDGLTFWGLGQYQTGAGQTTRQAWTVTIPAPAAAPVLAFAGLLAARRRR
jgi:hypothetical protein